MTWLLGMAITVLVVALVLVARRDVRVSHHQQAVTQGFGMMVVGLSMISVGLIGVLMDWSASSSAIPTVGLVFVAVGARRRRESSR